MNKRKLGIISFLMILALSILATGCGKAGETSSTETDPSHAAISFVSEESSDPSANDAEGILGTWDTVWDMSDLFNMMLSMDDDAMSEFVHIDKLDFPMQFTFNENGTYTITADEATLQASLEGMKEDLQAGLNRYFEYMIRENELDMTVEEMLAASGIESMDEYLDMVMGGFEGTSEAFESTGKWSIVDGKLYMVDEYEEFSENEYFTYELTENELKLLEVFSADMGENGTEELFGDLLDGLFPMVLTRAE